MDIYGRLILSWNDSRVTWDKKEWGISWLNFYWLQIWTPQLTQTNAPATKESEIKSKVLGANSAGNIFMWLDFSLSVLTDFDYSRFPFDQQRGCFKVDDKRHFAVHLKLDSNAGEFARNSLQGLHPARWDVVDIELLENQFSLKVLQNDVPVDAISSNLDICVTLKRDTSYIGLAVIGPCIATALITMMSFMASKYWNQIVTLIASIGLQIISAHSFISELPPASGVAPPFVKFCSFNLALTCILLILFGLLSFLTSLKHALPPPNWISRPISFICTFCPFFGKQSDQVKLGEDGTVTINEQTTPPTYQSPWDSVGKSIKIFFFIATFSLYVLAILISFSS
ncbi:unnamed protein product [Soboliphyme baturini]|uniref:Neur_chan_LBD domain-containing protein n=1 Tax=Soboliphyme baturini TaxID=241478 RepID=A0A183IW38_9BILA|nr:unnamed protein product [Soboliphyme baturini]